MLDTLFSSSLAALKRFDPGDIANSLGESQQSISRGLESSVATVLSGLSRNTGDSNVMQQVVDLASKAPGEMSAAAVAQSALTDPNSSLLSGGKRLLSTLFGSSEGSVVNAVSRGSNLRTGSAAAMLAVGAQSVLGLIGRRIRDEGLDSAGLSGLLQREGASFRGALPAGFGDLFGAVPAAAALPAAAVAVTKRRSGLWWLWALIVAILLLLWYLFAHRHPVPAVPAVSVPATLGNFVSRQLPDGTALNVPENGVESRLLAFIQDPSRQPDTTTWFDFDRLLFDTGSATLQPQSQEQLKNIAAILQAYPNVHIKIGGYTDNTGAADQNQKLSQDRADSVMTQLVSLGVGQDRLAAQGYGEDHPVADNSTESDGP